MRVDGENLGTAPIERVLMRYPGVTEVAVYGIPDPSLCGGYLYMHNCPDDIEFDRAAFRDFLVRQTDLGPKQWPSFVRVSSALPRTETFKVIKRHLSAEALDCNDPVFEIPR